MKTMIRLAKTRGTIPSLNNICIRGNKMIATDIDTFILNNTPSDLKDGFYHAIDFDKKAILNETPDFNADHFPELPTLEKADILDVLHLNAGQLESLAWVARAMSTEQVRYYLNGVCFDATNGAAVATDGHRLHKMDLPLTVAHPDYHMGYIIGSSDIKLLLALVAEEKPAGIEIIFYRNRWAANIGDCQIIGKYIDGTFPDWTRVMPSIDPAYDNYAAPQPYKLKDLKPILAEAKTYAKIATTKIQLFTFCEDGRAKIFYPMAMKSPVYMATPWAVPCVVGFSAQYFTDAPDKGEIRFPLQQNTPIRIDGEKHGAAFVLMANRNACQ